MRSNTIFAAGFVAASAVMAAPVEVRADNGPLLPASQGVQTESTGPLLPTTAASAGVQTESTGPLIPTTSASQAPLTTETTGPLIPTTSASASGAQTTETTGPLIPTTSASHAPLTTETTGPLIPTTSASGSASGSSTGTATGTVTASSSSGTGTATNSSATGSRTGTATHSSATGSSTGTASHSGSGTATSTGTASSTASASGSGSASGSSTGPAPTSTGTVTVTGTGTGTQTVNPPVTSVTPPPQVLTVLTTITEDFTEYVTYVPVTITNGGSGSETITVTQTVTEQNTVTVDGNGNGCAPTGTSTQSPPPPPHPTGSGGGSSFYPSAIYHYDVSTGAITCGVEDGLIEKFPTNKGQDITTLVTFTYPEESAGKKCQFEFFLSSASTLEGSGKIDVFTSLAPAPGCKAAWPPGNQRNVHAGRLSAHVGAFATWDATYGASYLTEPTDCKAPGTQEGIELVGVYDEDHVAWFPDGSGARIIYN